MTRTHHKNLVHDLQCMHMHISICPLSSFFRIVCCVYAYAYEWTSLHQKKINVQFQDNNILFKICLSSSRFLMSSKISWKNTNYLEGTQYIPSINHTICSGTSPYISVYAFDNRLVLTPYRYDLKWPLYPLGMAGFDRYTHWVWPILTAIPTGCDRVWPIMCCHRIVFTNVVTFLFPRK